MSKRESIRNKSEHELDTANLGTYQPAMESPSTPEYNNTIPASSTVVNNDEPLKPNEPEPSFGASLRNLILASRINVLLVFIPLGIIAHYLHWNDTAVFLLNFIAIIPLAKLLGFATEDISLRVGQTLGGLLNATFGNAVELIIAIIALNQGLIRVVQASMLGSILGNLLLVLGMCFAAGGFKYSEQSFNMTAAQTSSSLLALSCLSLLIPAAFHASAPSDNTLPILHLSYGTAIVILIVYILYLIFQLKTHKHLYADTAEAEEEESKQMHIGIGIATLVVVTVLVALCAEFLVSSIEGITSKWGLSETFVGLILLPIVGNAAEHVTAITVAMKNKMDLAIGVAIGSSTQIALLVTPFLVILGWIIGKEMTLMFDVFETTVLFISVLIVNYLIQDGKSNWLEGSMLLGTYLIVAIAFYFYPDPAGHGSTSSNTSNNSTGH